MFNLTLHFSTTVSHDLCLERSRIIFFLIEIYSILRNNWFKQFQSLIWHTKKFIDHFRNFQMDLCPKYWCYLCSEENDDDNSRLPCSTVCWRFIFVVTCLPLCYCCYLTRSSRRIKQESHKWNLVKNINEEQLIPQVFCWLLSEKLHELSMTRICPLLLGSFSVANNSSFNSVLILIFFIEGNLLTLWKLFN